MYLGFLLFCAIPVLLAASFIFGGVTRATTRHRDGSSAVTAAAFLYPLFLILQLFVFFLGPMGLSEQLDTDTGSFDTFKTPLGGGYFATSIDSSENTATLVQGNPEIYPVIAETSILKYGCQDNRTFLKLGKGYAIVDAKERKVTTFSSEILMKGALHIPYNVPLIWMTRDGFGSSACSPTENVLVMLLGFLWYPFNLLVSLSLFVGILRWRERVKAPVPAY